MGQTWISVVTVLCIASHFIGYSEAVFPANECLSSNAFYNDSIPVCQCSEGYKGLGDLCCDKSDDFSNCNVGGDPFLHSYDGSVSSYNWPCVGRVAVVTGASSNGVACVVEVMTTGKFVERGAEYPDRAVVTFRIGDGGRQIFKLVGKTIQRPGDASPYPSSDLYRKRLYRMTLSGERIAISYINSRNIWSITGCDTKITFRAAEDNKAVPYSRPGICVSIKKSSDMKPSGDPDAGDICSSSVSDLPTAPKTLPYDLLTKLIIDYGSLGVDVRSVHPNYQPVCDKVSKVFEDGCDEDKMTSAVKGCGPILYNSVIRRCLNVAGVSGTSMVDLFATCMGFRCNDKLQECQDYTQTTPALKTCMPTFCGTYTILP